MTDEHRTEHLLAGDAVVGARPRTIVGATKVPPSQPSTVDGVRRRSRPWRPRAAASAIIAEDAVAERGDR